MRCAFMLHAVLHAVRTPSPHPPYHPLAARVPAFANSACVRDRKNAAEGSIGCYPECLAILSRKRHLEVAADFPDAFAAREAIVCRPNRQEPAFTRVLRGLTHEVLGPACGNCGSLFTREGDRRVKSITAQKTAGWTHDVLAKFKLARLDPEFGLSIASEVS